MTKEVAVNHFDMPQTIRLGMISNPNSGRNRRHLRSICTILNLSLIHISEPTRPY